MQETEYKVIPSTLSGLVGNLDKGSPETPPAPEVPAYVPTTEEVPSDGGGGDLLPADFEDPDAPAKPGGGVSKAQGRIVSRVIDRGAATGLSIIAKGDVKDYKATDDEYADLEEAVILYMQETNMQMSPLLGLILAILAIYGLKVPEAIRARREVEKVERAEQAAMIAEREAKLRGGNYEPSAAATT